SASLVMIGIIPVAGVACPFPSADFDKILLNRSCGSRYETNGGTGYDSTRHATADIVYRQLSKHRDSRAAANTALPKTGGNWRLERTTKTEATTIPTRRVSEGIPRSRVGLVDTAVSDGAAPQTDQ